MKISRNAQFTIYCNNVLNVYLDCKIKKLPQKMHFLIWTIFQSFYVKSFAIYIFLLTGPIFEKRGMGGIFQKNGKISERKGQNWWKLEQILWKCMKCENFFKKGSPLCAIIPPNKLLEWALIQIIITLQTFKIDRHIIQKPLNGCYV